MNNIIGQPKLLKEINNRRVLEILSNQRVVSRSQLTKQTGLSKATISLLVDKFLRIGFLENAGTGNSSGGRPPTLLKFKPNIAYALGAHMRDREWHLVATNLDGKIVYSMVFNIPNNTPCQAISVLVKGVRSLMNKVPKKKILPALGIGTPGLVDVRSGIIKSAVDIGWADVPIKKMVEEELSLQVFIANRSKCGALAEYWNTESPGLKDLIYISIGTGVAAGIIHNGELFIGANSYAGELGHITILPNGPVCPCGNRGCLQQLISKNAIEKRAKKKLTGNYKSILKKTSKNHSKIIEVYDVIEAAENGDKFSQEIIEEISDYLSIAVGNLINLFNPQLIIIGGPIGTKSGLLIQYLREKVRKRAMVYPLATVEIKSSSLGTNASAIGASVLVLQKIHQLLSI